MNNKKNTDSNYLPEYSYGSDHEARKLPREPYELDHLSDEVYYQSNFSFNRSFESAQVQIHRTWREQRRSVHNRVCPEQCQHPHIVTQGEVLIFGNYSSKKNPEITVNKSGTEIHTWNRVDSTYKSHWSNQGSYLSDFPSLELDNRVLFRDTYLNVDGLLEVESISGEIFGAYPHELLWPEFYFNYEIHNGVKYMTPGDFHYFEEVEVHSAHALNLTKSKRTRWGHLPIRA